MKILKIAITTIMVMMAGRVIGADEAEEPVVTGTSINVSEVITQIGTHGTTAITMIGTVIIVLAGVAMVFKWTKGAIFS